MAKQFTLAKTERLKSRKAIEQLFKEGNRFTITPFRVFYMPAPIKELKLGVGVSAKNFKKSVDRNRIKRLIKEAYRLQKNPLQESLQENNKGLSLFIIFTAKELPEYKLVNEKLVIILNKLIKIMDEKNSTNS